MNRIMIMSAAIGLAAAATTGCNSGGGGEAGSGYVPTKPKELNSAILPGGSEADYFPFAVGNQWTFESESSTTAAGRTSRQPLQEVTYKITELKTNPDGSKDASFQILTNDTVVDRQIWRVDKAGIWQVALGKKLSRFSTPQLMIPFPATAGAKFKWSGSIKVEGGENRTGKNEGVIVGPEPIDTPMGTYNALAVENKGTLNDSKTKSQIASRVWLIPKVGIGRYRQEQAGVVTGKDKAGKTQQINFVMVQLIKLKNFSPKK